MLKIRLRRMGAIRQPHYRIVVADARSPRDGRFFETLGSYNPLTDPSTISIDLAKYEDWKRKGAQPTEAVASLVSQLGKRAAQPAEEGSAPSGKGGRTAKGSKAEPVVSEAAQAETAQAESETADAGTAPAESAPQMSEAPAEATPESGAAGAEVADSEGADAESPDATAEATAEA